jgi:hypothetical protein
MLESFSYNLSFGVNLLNFFKKNILFNIIIFSLTSVWRTS